MSDIRTQTIVNPDLDDLLDELKNEIFSTLNCIQVGKIESYNTDEQTVEVQIQFKRRLGDGETKSYPLLVDCPVIVMQGGGTYLEFPIQVGDYCLVLFNDRNIDTWWDAGTVKEPLTTRKHDLSDGFALVGINPKTSILDLTGDKVRIVSTGFPLDIETDEDINIRTDAGIIINDGTDFMVRYNELETAYDQLKSDFDTLVSTFNSHIHPATTTATVGIGPVGVVTVTPTTTTGSPSTGDISLAKIDDINVPGVGE